MTYRATIGLEIHAELKTKTKMFCSSLNDPDETRPNVNICPVCVGHPGSLPVANRQAIGHVLKVGLAVGGKIADYTEFDRKNYFYPDLPKGYQISQYEYPLVSGGTLNGIQLTRIHLEEDTARSQHSGSDTSVVDFNRSGVPLMELVTEPVIHDSETAKKFAEELQRVLRYIGAGDADMEKGQMRVEANISVSTTDTMGVKVEVKNLNSFRSVLRAIEYEIKRQSEALDAGEVIQQETRGWDEQKGVTYSQRAKESSHDYRYFPDPDIPKLRLSRIAEFRSEILEKFVPEMPWVKRERLSKSGLDAASASILVDDDMYASVYASEVEPILDERVRKSATNILLSTIRGLGPTEEQMRGLKNSLRKAAEMFVEGAVSSAAVSAAFSALMKTDSDFETLVGKMGLLQVNDDSLLKGIAVGVISQNASVVDEYKRGKLEALKYLVGQGMKLSKGSAHPAKLEEVIKSLIAS